MLGPTTASAPRSCWSRGWTPDRHPHVGVITFENDDFHGWPLHKIRSKIEPNDPEPWKGVLPEALCRLIDENYADINHYARGA